MSAAVEAASPPSCNTGASGIDSGLRWDWYQATLTGISAAGDVLDGLIELAPDGSTWEASRPLYGYKFGWSLPGFAQGSLSVFAGGQDVHVQATGAVAELLVPLLRQLWPGHSVSRADVAYDVVEPGGFDRLYQRVDDLARSNPRGRVGTSVAGDWLHQEAGRTFYAGGTSSRLRVVVYEKGHEQLRRDPGCGASTDWVRVEWRLRPTSDQKQWLAGASRSEALGLSSFGARVAGELLGSDVVPVGNLLRFASEDPAYWMAKQYRRVLVDLLELEPGEVVAYLRELVESTAVRQ